ncbi:2-amino-4-hydroxy-6-hydroxymethyldihydropteridine diphosphokinase [Campylobacter sp. 19-13652]|uniref:2-amino-4-hydroxy-6- hydroxymethyldihydropteridine diphosphokinase n=1 Tax=Campylobacter sp. 19-13652 TaxID=2840180 RepID=UPI001C77A871|nr:2-amino-4-hydroxy-6-hydroxymethyldihydropteridine diphosphokinase [Campylobacter sp. 19-13652]BCX78883.1 2-amino-4-hydroxy-6-hydroxymethyldihydropteridine pyrophosphokinase [Campylobacter sp. 19-13652]
MFIKLKGAKALSRTRFFPLIKSSNGRYSAIIGLGGNIGDSAVIFKRLLRMWQDDRRISVAETSPLFINAAFGYTNQADFTNAVTSIKTNLSALNLLKILQHYEIKFKRKRSFKNAPRTLDLDMLYYSGRSRNSKKLTLPHQGADRRISVIVPLGIMKG